MARTSALESYQTAREAAHKEAAARYRHMVEVMAGDEDVDPEEGNAILTAAGKTFMDLQADVERLVHRHHLVNVLAELPEVRHRTRAAADALAAAEAERVRALADQDRRVAHAKAAVEASREQERVCSDAGRELRATADPELLARVADLGRQRQRAADKVRDLRKQVEKYKPTAEREVPDLPGFVKDGMTGSVLDLDRRDILLHHKEAVAAKAAAAFRMSKLTPEMAAAEMEFDRLEAELAAAAAALLVP